MKIRKPKTQKKVVILIKFGRKALICS